MNNIELGRDGDFNSVSNTTLMDTLLRKNTWMQLNENIWQT